MKVTAENGRQRWIDGEENKQTPCFCWCCIVRTEFFANSEHRVINPGTIQVCVYGSRLINPASLHFKKCLDLIIKLNGHPT